MVEIERLSASVHLLIKLVKLILSAALADYLHLSNRNGIKMHRALGGPPLAPKTLLLKDYSI